MKRLIALSLLVGMAALAGCSGAPPEPSMAQTYPFIRLAPTPPPAPLFEEKPVNLSPGSQIWRPGYWDYDGTDFSWIPGQFMDKPTPTAAWAADRWQKHQFGWGFIPGHWQ